MSRAYHPRSNFLACPNFSKWQYSVLIRQYSKGPYVYLPRMSQFYCPELHSQSTYTLASHEAVCSLAALLHMQSPHGKFAHGALADLARQIHGMNPTRSFKSAQNLVSIARKCARCYRPLLEIYRIAFADLPDAYREAASSALSSKLVAELEAAGYQRHHNAIDEYLTVHFDS